MANSRERHKSIAIPVSYVGGIPHFLIVHDRRYKEWTFVTGGCRRREVYNPLRCALRELEEETRGLMNIKEGHFSHFTFSTTTQEQRDIEDGVDALNFYNVYLFEVPMTKADHTEFIRKFNEERSRMEGSVIPFRKNYDENDGCRFCTLDTIAQCNMWPMITKHVLQNKDFIEALLHQEKKAFNIR